MDRVIVIRYGELSTKGNNKHLFIDSLAKAVRHALKGLEVETKKTRDHIYVYLDKDDAEEAIKRLSPISGIQKISLGEKVEADKDAILTKCDEVLKKRNPKNWKARVKRADKNFPIDSMELSSLIGGYCLKHGAPPVEVHDPDFTLNVEVREDGAYVFSEEHQGAGGYPLGMNGKVMMMLSGGIDSPVAAYSLIRRGLVTECVHFASPPYTSDAVLDKLGDILGVLSTYQEKIRLHVVPFTKLQEAIYQNVPEPYCITIMRRMMMRIAVGLAKKNRCLAVATGESIGQVASQTLESLVTINEVTNYPVLRPLATSDKLEIIGKAKEIGTYEISIRPFEDCCTIFAPRSPKTKPKLEEAIAYESRFDWQSLVGECVDNASVRTYPIQKENPIF